MKRFKKRGDLVRHAIKNVFKRQAEEQYQMKMSLKHRAGDFLQQCAAKLRLPR